jgi:hypothetical protein
VINATYCTDGCFAHVSWHNGTVAHVNMTAEEYRKYDARMTTGLRRLERRISWLRQGSREVFGTILEKKVYILIDTSSSMVNYIEFVKDRLEHLVKEQLEARKCKRCWAYGKEREGRLRVEDVAATKLLIEPLEYQTMFDSQFTSPPQRCI